MNPPAESSFLLIRPLVERHVGDAAFYWQQHDQSAHSPLINWPALSDFDRLLNAHLDGVRVAGDAGWQLALQALERWGGAGEVFVCATLALEQRREAWWQAVIEAVRRKPERLLRGLISAVLWLPSGQMLERVEPWLQPAAAEFMQTIAWRVLARCEEAVGDLSPFQPHLAAALHHPGIHLRAAACRASLRLQQTGQISACLNDEAGAVIVEAAIALQRTGNLQGQAKLQTIVAGTAKYIEPLSGYHRQRAQHRFGRWLRYLAIALTPGSAGVEALLAPLPPRLMLQFILYHGDTTWLPWVHKHLNNPDCARYAGWVWSALTGIDLDANGLSLPIQLDTRTPTTPTDDQDPGLALPNATAITHFALSLPSGQRILLGQTLDTLKLRGLLHQAPQALRWIAARHLEQQTGFSFNTRAPARQQAASLSRLSTQDA